MFVRKWFAAALVIALAAPVRADSPEVGATAPHIGSFRWVMNLCPHGGDVSRQGHTVVVVTWAFDDPASLAVLARLQRLHDEFGAPRLTIYALLANAGRFYSNEDVRDRVLTHGGRTFTISATDSPNWRADATPRAWVVGIDGRVSWVGDPAAPELEATVRASQAQLPPGNLPRQEFDRALARSLRFYERGDFTQAIEAAQKVASDHRARPQASQDARTLLAHYRAVSERQHRLAQMYEYERRFLEAHALYEALGESHPDAAARVQAMDADPAIRPELDASRRLATVAARVAKRPPEERRVALQAFVDDAANAGTYARDHARSLIGLLPAP